MQISQQTRRARQDIIPSGVSLLSATIISTNFLLENALLVLRANDSTTRGSAREQLAVKRHYGSVAGIRRSYLSDGLKYIRRLHILGRGKVTSTLAAATVALQGSSNGTNDMQRLLTGSVKGRNPIASRDHKLLGKSGLISAHVANLLISL
ncbi:hypothetical protein VM1G_12000 [Cytospora mali]|uniref:Uncharacterized protein n=1 Tax=Cytospora mali TaxID=578113 RepID=A0A194VHJ1_CYTMA|nr:hypothetical protein VM1G_12000 [Valsa mali]